MRQWRKKALGVLAVIGTTIAALYVTQQNYIVYEPNKMQVQTDTHKKKETKQTDIHGKEQVAETPQKSTYDKNLHKKLRSLDLSELSLKELETTVYSLLSTTTYNCPTVKRMGSRRDGGWFVCVDDKYKPSNKCLVYSFGIGTNWSFDKAMSGEEYECEVHSFDPSINLKDHKHAERIWFHNTGIAAINKNKDPKRGWKLRTLKMIRKELGHLESPIDVLKMDVERAEWLIIPNMIENKQFNKIKQFCIELHFSQKADKEIFKKVYKLLMSLYSIGLEMFASEVNVASYYISPISGKRYGSLNNLYFVNKNFHE